MYARARVRIKKCALARTDCGLPRPDQAESQDPLRFRYTIAEESGGAREPDFLPVVKLFTPDAGATWLLTEIDPEDHDSAFGLCDLGLGFPELGYVSLSEIAAVRGALRLPVERDQHFAPTKTISAYGDEACRPGRIE